MAIGVRQPGVKGKERHLDQDADPNENESDLHGSGISQVVRLNGLPDAHHVEGARLDVYVTDAEQVEGGPYGPEDDVVEGTRRGTLGTDGDQAVSR